ncbi:UDP-N-acetylmuramoylalanine--D-glutamate ligase [Gordonia soli NBRC 108243]|uniref:UDP-N-acetylmuramoylalanine--D-glutamate ligase n=1 Tax=Gordonia soli NBRC 108243 TaxID=1223545 RepID=M0QLU7_9ACTN|nr:UDP-N-acetylmuramoylalanine--D-glutamate ligase [Gordonia soli NBRC 108243]
MGATVPDLSTATVVVAGAGTAGRSAADHLLAVGARVVLADTRFGSAADGPAVDRPVADDPVAPLHERGARLVSIDALTDDPSWTVDTDLVVVSPGFTPTHPLAELAQAHGLPVWGEVELAWHVDSAGVLGPPRTWLVVTGTNGKTTTTSMLEQIVTTGGREALACGNIGLPVLDALRRTPRVEVLCVEMSSFQLHWAPSVHPAAGVVLNVAPDHLDWHGTFAAYAEAKAGALRGEVAIVGLDDEVASGLASPAGARRVGITLAEPREGQVGIVDGRIVDRAFDAGDDLADVEVIHPPGPSGRTDAVAAAALAAAIGVGADAIRTALADFRPAAHRGEVVAVIDGVAFVDDSKATNPHAAQAAVLGHRRVVLVAGGLLKGADVTDLVIGTRDRLAGVVAIGRDRTQIVDAIARHAPEVPTVTLFTGDDGRVTIQRTAVAVPGAAPLPADPPVTGTSAVTDVDRTNPSQSVMNAAVAEAWTLAVGADDRPDAVLLAPAAASFDMFAGYGARGDAFAGAALALPGATRPGAGR